MLLESFKFLHYAGLILGVGGATFSSILMSKAGKDADVGKAMGKLMPSFIKMIWLGMLLLMISGIALPFFISWPIDRKLLIIKHVLVVWIIIFGVFLGIKSRKISLLDKNDKEKAIKTGKQIKFISKINLLLWWLITLMSVFV